MNTEDMLSHGVDNRLKAERAIDTVLSLMYLCEEDEHRLSVPLKGLDGAVPLIDTTLDNRGDDVRVLTISGEPPIWPLDSKVLYPLSEITKRSQDSESIGFHRVRSIALKEARQLGASKFAPKMVMHEEGACHSSGKAQSGKAPYALLGKRWVKASQGILCDDSAINVEKAITLTINTALTMRYEWSVWLGFGDGPRVRFVSDPAGAIEAFKLRDVPPGRVRRSALRNWVAEHSRKKRSDPDAITWIRRHLRGQTDFVWNGMRCKIQPPDFEVERLMALNNGL